MSGSTSSGATSKKQLLLGGGTQPALAELVGQPRHLRELGAGDAPGRGCETDGEPAVALGDDAEVVVVAVGRGWRGRPVL